MTLIPNVDNIDFLVTRILRVLNYSLFAIWTKDSGRKFKREFYRFFIDEPFWLILFIEPNTPGKFIVWFRNETTLLVLWQPPYPAGIYTHYKVSIDPPDAIESVFYVEKEGEPPGPAQAAFKGLVPGKWLFNIYFNYQFNFRQIDGKFCQSIKFRWAEMRNFCSASQKLRSIQESNFFFQIQSYPPQSTRL